MNRSTIQSMPSQVNGSVMSSGPAYTQYPAPDIQLSSSEPVMDSLSEELGRFNLRAAEQGGVNGMNVDNKALDMSESMVTKAGAHYLVQLEDGTLVYSGSPQYLYQNYNNNNNNNHLAVPLNTQPHHMSYGNMTHTGGMNGPNTPRGQPWYQHQSIPPVPDLVNRRGSWSSNEEASPQTPAFGNWQTPIYTANYSPSAWSTPSPMTTNLAPFYHYARKPNGEPYIVDYGAWTRSSPRIPQPVPAHRSGPDGGRGSLDKILDNPDGTTNVYVRGLQPDTTDEVLGLYGKRFGDIESQKAIIDHSTGKCKGFGFIKYHNFIAAENCIRAFYHLGYEAKFARESHNSRLKALADNANTNLYISNLPKLINEDGLKNIFASVFPPENFPEYRAGSCKILKDSCGISRGVGFARFESPQICDIIIQTFNNKMIGEGEDATNLQVRYADTPKQKELKAQTAVKRQFKAAEYNEAAYNIPFPDPSPTSSSFDTPFHRNATLSNGPWMEPSPVSSISPSNFTAYPNSVLRARRGSLGLPRFVRAPQSTHIKIESPSAIAAAKKAGNQSTPEASTDLDSCNRSERAQVSTNSTSVSTFISDVGISPTKTK